MEPAINESNIAIAKLGNKKKNKNKNNNKGRKSGGNINGVVPESARMHIHASTCTGLLNSKSDYIKMLLKPEVGSNIEVPGEGVSTSQNDNISSGGSVGTGDNQKLHYRTHASSSSTDNRNQVNHPHNGGRGHHYRNNDAYNRGRYIHNNHQHNSNNARYHSNVQNGIHAMSYLHYTGNRRGSTRQYDALPGNQRNESNSQVIIQLTEKDDEVCARTNYQIYLAQGAAFESQDAELEYHLRYMYHSHLAIINEHAESVALTAEMARRKATDDWLKSRSVEERERYLSNYRGASNGSTFQYGTIASAASEQNSDSSIESKKMENTASPQTVVRSGSVTDSGEKPIPLQRIKENLQKNETKKSDKPPIAPIRQ